MDYERMLFEAMALCFGSGLVGGIIGMMIYNFFKKKAEEGK